MNAQKLRMGYGYIRVSTHDQEELSPDSQERLLRQYAQANNIILERIFIDAGISGRKAEKRPAFQEMIARAKSQEHPVDVLLVWKFSRFARNQEESIVYKSLLKKARVEVLSVSEPLVEGPFGSLIERIIEWMDEYYSIRLSGEVMRGMTDNAKLGHYQSVAPLGYKNVNRTLEIIPEEASIIQMIFTDYLDNHKTFGSIARKLNELGIKTKRGGLWENRTVKYILQNPVYKGYSRWNVGRNNLRGPSASSPDMIVAKGDYPAIISEEIFEQTQEAIARSYRQPKRRPSESCGHWLVGIVKCSCCGSSLSYSRTYGNFQCISYAKGKCKESHHISAQSLVESIINTLEAQLETGTIEYEMEAADTPAQSDEVYLLRDAIERIEIKEKRIKAAYQDGIDSLEEYRQNKLLLSQERERLQAQLDELETPVHTDTAAERDNDMLLRVRGIVDILKSDADKETKSLAIRSICDKIIYDKKAKTLDIYCVFRKL